MIQITFEVDLDKYFLKKEGMVVPENWPTYIANELNQAVQEVAMRYDAVSIYFKGMEVF